MVSSVSLLGFCFTAVPDLTKIRLNDSLYSRYPARHHRSDSDLVVSAIAHSARTMLILAYFRNRLSDNAIAFPGGSPASPEPVHSLTKVIPD